LTVLAPTSKTLRVERLSLADWSARCAAAPQPLGSLGYGLADADGVAARVLSSGGPCVDAWFAGSGITSGRSGSVDWRHDGQWLWGSLSHADGDDGEAALAKLAELAYRDVFATLAATGYPHLQRVWNYLPRINADGGGLERYRQFNLGRQQAFLDCGQPAFEGAPAACAIGTQDGPFSLRFLAGRKRPLAVENPRQVSAYRYPSDYGPRSPSFSRAALVDAGGGATALLISGTASIVGHESRHAGDVRAQTRETLANLQALIETAHARTAARFALRDLVCVVYVRHAADWPAIEAELRQALGADAPALQGALALEADICRADLLVEIEAHGFASAA
jgi:enamine deaminase RidA (YjgF/YER057c/UK114 family)